MRSPEAGERPAAHLPPSAARGLKSGMEAKGFRAVSFAVAGRSATERAQSRTPKGETAPSATAARGLPPQATRPNGGPAAKLS